MLLSLDYLTSLFYYIPKAALAAVIITAVAPLFDAKIVRTLWRVKSMYFLTCQHEVISCSPTAFPKPHGLQLEAHIAGRWQCGALVRAAWERGLPSPSPPGTCQGAPGDIGMASRDQCNSPHCVHQSPWLKDSLDQQVP